MDAFDETTGIRANALWYSYLREIKEFIKETFLFIIIIIIVIVIIVIIVIIIIL